MRSFLYLSTLVLQSLGVFSSDADIPEPDVSCTAVTPVPTGCGIRGNVIYDKQPDFPISSPQIVDNVEECASYCERRRYIKNKEYWGYLQYYPYDYQPFCHSFEYTTNTSLCTLGSLDVTTNVKPSSKSNAVYYNTGCFDCGEFCDQPYGDQLIDNGDFEDSLLGPWKSTKGSLTKGHQSKRAYYCAEDYSNRCSLSQEINMCKKQLYAIQFDYLTLYTNQTRHRPHFFVGFGGFYYTGGDENGVFTYNGYSDNTDANAWKTIRGYFRYLDTDHPGPYFRFDGGGSTSIDNVYISRVPKPTLAASAKNLFKNAGFETGDLTSWKTHDFQYGFVSQMHNLPFKVVSPGINSKHAVFFQSTDAYDNQASMYLSQTVTTKPNTTYQISFDVHILNRFFEVNMFVGPNDARTRHGRHWKAGNYTVSIPVIATTTETLVQFEVTDEYRNFGKALLDNFKMLEVAKSAYFP